MSTRILPGDCRDVLKTLEADSLHACLTDPPYGLGFMGKEWDSGSVAFDPATWRSVYRVLKPGAYLMAFGGTRTYHRLACAIEDSGFEIRDQFGWAYGQGFPKSYNASKAIDQAAGRKGVEVAVGNPVLRMPVGAEVVRSGSWAKQDDTYQPHAYTPATPEAAAWAGWGTAVKPAWEPIVLARKPMIGNLAKNLLTHGCGALNIDACRIEGVKPVMERTKTIVAATSMAGTSTGARSTGEMTTEGRWPANLAHDGSDEVMAAFAAYGDRPSAGGNPKTRSAVNGLVYGDSTGGQDKVVRNDTGSAARFFYSAKADKADRADSKHPTVKPVDLIQHYLRLIVPPGGTVIDCFAGSGTTGEAAMLEGFDCILIERDPQSVADIQHRIKRWSGADMPLFAEVSCA